jgi:Transposase DDE domain
MQGTKSCLSAKIDKIMIVGKIRRRILLHLLPLFLTLPRRINFTQLTKWGEYNENTYHNWFTKDLDLVSFNVDLIKQHGSGEHFILFDPSFLNKSGKKTPSVGNFWSGCAGAVKRGLEMSCLAVADMQQHTAYHLSTCLTPLPKDLKAKHQTLIDFYAEEVLRHEQYIITFGKMVVADGAFGAYNFVKPLLKKGIDVTSCLKSNACLFYLAEPVIGKRKRGRPKVKDGKIDWQSIDKERLAIVKQDQKKIVRSAKVYSKSLKMIILLVAVDYLNDDGSFKNRKLYFTTKVSENFERILEIYQIRFQIEFLFRDAKQYTGLMHCQSTNLTKINNHLNLSLTSVSVAKATHWNKDPKTPFSMAEIKEYYHNLRLIELFSEALGLEPNTVKNNPKIVNILKPRSYLTSAA